MIDLKNKQKDEDEETKKIKSKYERKKKAMCKTLKSEEEEELKKSKLSSQSTKEIITDFKAARKDLLDNICDNCRLLLNDGQKDSTKSSLLVTSKTSKSNYAGNDSYSGSTLPNMKGQLQEQLNAQDLVLVAKLQDQVMVYHSKASDVEQKNAILEGDIKRLNDQLADFKAKIRFYESNLERKENRIAEHVKEIDEVKLNQKIVDQEAEEEEEEELCTLHEELSNQQKEFDAKPISYNNALQGYKHRDKSSSVDQNVYSNTKKELDSTKHSLETMEIKFKALEKHMKIFERENRKKETVAGMTKFVCSST